MSLGNPVYHINHTDLVFEKALADNQSVVFGLYLTSILYTFQVFQTKSLTTLSMCFGNDWSTGLILPTSIQIPPLK